MLDMPGKFATTAIFFAVCAVIVIGLFLMAKAFRTGGFVAAFVVLIGTGVMAWATASILDVPKIVGDTTKKVEQQQNKVKSKIRVGE
jgi:hypothetical protein